MASIRHFDKPFKLYHLSEQNYDGKVFEPRPMEKFRVMEGEDWKVPRICVSDSIDGAVSALLDSVTMPYGKRLWVHVPENLIDLFKQNKVYKPSLKQVPDATATGEHWLKAPAKMKTIGQIEVTDIDETADVTYLWYGKKTQLDRFVWHWRIMRI